MFNVGDKVCYPMHGAGIIVGIDVKEILNEKREYYTIKIPVGDVMISCPVANAESIGLRPVIGERDRDEILETLRGKRTSMAQNWNHRNRENVEKLKTGDVLEVAEVVRNLILMSKTKPLSGGDRRMLGSATDLLVSEIILAFDIDEKTAHARIDECFE